MRNLSKEIDILHEEIDSLIDCLIFADIALQNGDKQEAENQIETVYWQMFKRAQDSDKLKALLAEGERKGKAKVDANFPIYKEGLDDD